MFRAARKRRQLATMDRPYFVVVFGASSASFSGSGHETVPSVHGGGSLAGNDSSKAASIAASLKLSQSTGCVGDVDVSFSLSMLDPLLS